MRMRDSHLFSFRASFRPTHRQGANASAEQRLHTAQETVRPQRPPALRELPQRHDQRFLQPLCRHWRLFPRWVTRYGTSGTTILAIRGMTTLYACPRPRASEKVSRKTGDRIRPAFRRLTARKPAVIGAAWHSGRAGSLIPVRKRCPFSRTRLLYFEYIRRPDSPRHWPSIAVIAGHNSRSGKALCRGSENEFFLAASGTEFAA